LFKRALGNRIERYRYRDFLMPVNQQGGIQSAAEDVQRAVRFVRVKDYEDYIARLESSGAMSTRRSR